MDELLSQIDDLVKEMMTKMHHKQLLTSFFLNCQIQKFLKLPKIDFLKEGALDKLYSFCPNPFEPLFNKIFIDKLWLTEVSLLMSCRLKGCIFAQGESSQNTSKMQNIVRKGSKKNSINSSLKTGAHGLERGLGKVIKVNDQEQNQPQQITYWS